MIRNKYIVVIKYTESLPSEIDKKIDYLDYEVNRIVSYLKDKDDFTKELIINDYLSKNVNYDYTKNKKNTHNIYGALVEKEAVCDGFTNACNVLLNKCNIESILVLGNLKDELHAWNLVKIGGNYYHLDVTSNISLKKDEGIYNHMFFNVTDEKITKTHKIKYPKIYPKCTETKDNFYVKKGFILKNTDNPFTKINEIIDNSLNKQIIEFKNLDVPNLKTKMVDVLSKRKDKKSNSVTYYQLEDIIIVKR